MKKIYFIFIFFLVIVIAFVSYFIFWFKGQTKPVSTSTNKVRFVVDIGQSASVVGENLYKESLIRNKLVFKIYLQVLDKTKNINAGEFELSPSMSVSEIVTLLGKGPKELWVTIPEGLRKEEVVDRITKALEMEEGKGAAFKESFLSLTKTNEGYLFPDTYLFPRDIEAGSVVGRLRSTFDKKYNDIKQADKNRYSKSEVVIMASILERETKNTSEKPIVAGILWKRIANDWPLQVDASVQYAVSDAALKNPKLQVTDWWPVLTLEDLNINSPFNSYKFKGLPPAPICNPGLTSLEAAANPEDSEYWFYIHSPDGQIHYARSSEEHASNVRKYLGKN